MTSALDVLSIYLGDQLGLYRSLHREGPATPDQLAQRTGIHPRYAREWMEHQTVAGLLDVADPDVDERLFHLSEDHAEVLANTDSMSYITPFARVIGAAATQLPSLVDAYRTGDGVPWAQYGDAMRTGQGDANRALFLQSLGSQWLPSVPTLHATLRAGGRVADVGCGEGWSSIAIALAYPEVTVVGIDLDPDSVEAARKHAADHGVAERVEFRIGDAADAAEDGAFDLVTAFECIHDIANPVQVLAAMRQLVKDDGHVLVMDERVGERFTGEDEPVEHLMYGMSVLVCLPDAMSHSPSAATGTVIRPETLRGYANEAGFSDVDVLPIEADLFRFYSLRS